MGINRKVTERFEFGRLFLDFSNPAAPIGSVVYVQRDDNGRPMPGRDITLDAGPELIGPLVAQATMPGVSVATNIVLLCDALMQARGMIFGGVSDMEVAQEAAAAPAEPVQNTEDADPPPAVDPVADPVVDVPAEPAEPEPAAAEQPAAEPAEAAPADPAPADPATVDAAAEPAAADPAP